MNLDVQRIIGTAKTLLRQHEYDVNAHGLGRAWSNFTPTWTATGTQPAINTGIINLRYIQIGKTVFWSMLWAPTSLTTFGTGTYEFTLPVKPRYNVSSGTASSQVLGQGNFHDASTTNVYETWVYLARANAQSFVLALAGGGASWLGATVPVTLADNDTIHLHGMYEAE